jgi:hypothetical protein
MKKHLFITLITICSIGLISWGVTGHRTIGRIAENHLSAKAKAGIQALLGNQSLADVSTWADEVRLDPEYRQTASWHFLNLPLCLTFPEFKQRVENMKTENVYSALLQQEHILTNPSSSRNQQIVALKFIVHFVGDLHQPMHVSRAEDKGGSTIQLNYDGHGINLHSLWDTKLLHQAGSSYERLAEKYDHPTPEQIKKWQSDPLITWVWESYQLSTRLYAEVAAMHGHKINNRYYETHISIIQDRIEKAGIRLAGILNQLFERVKVNGGVLVKEPPALNKQTPKAIKIIDAESYINETVTISAKVYGTKSFGSMVLVNLGAAYPNQLLTVVLREGAKDMADAIGNKIITVTGTLIDYRGRPEIVVTDVKQISFQ